MSRFLTLMLASTLVAGCSLTGQTQMAPQAYPYGQPPMTQGGMMNPAALPPAGQMPPAAYQGQPMPQPMMMPQQQPSMENSGFQEFAALNDRITRVERAMIRLDRRMQLLEKNELGRMSSMGAEPQAGPDALQQFRGQTAMPAAGPAGSVPPVVSPRAQIGPMSDAMENFSPGFRPASFGGVTSSLQAAPVLGAEALEPQSTRALPSLADEAEAQKAADAVAIWTVQYSAQKLWPERDQMAASREVVEALRSGKPVALFARGQHPSSREFRDRVQALGRYLSKVASLENVPIATMPAEHLSNETIEILATY